MTPERLTVEALVSLPNRLAMLVGLAWLPDGRRGHARRRARRARLVAAPTPPTGPRRTPTRRCAGWRRCSHERGPATARPPLRLLRALDRLLRPAVGGDHRPRGHRVRARMGARGRLDRDVAALPGRRAAPRDPVLAGRDGRRRRRRGAVRGQPRLLPGGAPRPPTGQGRPDMPSKRYPETPKWQSTPRSRSSCRRWETRSPRAPSWNGTSRKAIPSPKTRRSSRSPPTRSTPRCPPPRPAPWSRSTPPRATPCTSARCSPRSPSNGAAAPARRGSAEPAAEAERRAGAGGRRARPSRSRCPRWASRSPRASSSSGPSSPATRSRRTRRSSRSPPTRSTPRCPRPPRA